MTDEQDNDKKDPQAQAAESADSAEPEGDPAPSEGPRPNKSPARSPGSLWLLWLLVLVLAAGGGYLWWGQQQYQQRESRELAQLREQLDRLSRQQQDWQDSSARQLDNLSTELRQQLVQLEQRQRDQRRDTLALEEQLAASVRALQTRTGADRDTWLLAEAEYLLRLAGQRLVIERDAGAALALTRAVDDILRELANPELHLVRRALTRDINNLAAVEAVDREGIYLRLMTLSEQLDDLPPMSHPSERLRAGNDEDDDAEPDAEGLWDSVRQTFRRSVRELNKYIRISRDTEAMDDILLPRDQQHLTANLHLMLEQAGTAMLREEAELYRVSLGRADKWLERHYGDSDTARQMREELRSLMATAVRPNLPELGDSLALLRAHRQQSGQESQP